MEIVVVKTDNLVCIDGECSNFNVTLPSNIWSLHWNGVTGEVEFSDSTDNLTISDFSPYQTVVDEFNAEKQRLADSALQEEKDVLAARTYVDDRRDNYPTLADQADMQYHDAVDGTTTWKDSIASVKNTFPKV